MRKARKNYFIYLMMLLIFGGLIYTAIAGGERFLHLSSIKPATAGDDAFTMFKTILLDNLEHPFSILLIQIIVVLIAVRIFASIIRKSKFPQNPKRSVRFSGKRTKRSVQKRKARNTQKAETKVL